MSKPLAPESLTPATPVPLPTALAPLVHLHNVSKRYGTKEGVEELTLTLHPGQVVGLLGLNGAGKSTTLKLLSGLLLPTRGTVKVLGKSARANRGAIAYLSETDTLYPWMTPRDAARFMQGLFPDFQPERYTELLAFLKVPNRRASAMSKGLRSRMRLAMTLAREAKLFLLDEPLAGIDLISREQILGALVRQWREEACLILSTHEVYEAERLFDRALFLRDGRLVLDAEPERLRAEGKSVTQTFREVLA